MKRLKSKKAVWGASLAGVALIVAVASGAGASEDGWAGGLGDADASSPATDALTSSFAQMDDRHAQYRQDSSAVSLPAEGPDAANGQAEQALDALVGLRQQQCQMGNQMACQALPAFNKVRAELARSRHSCRAGASSGCDSYAALSQRIFKSYSETAAVMQAGEQGMANMNAWRNQMNQNAANSMANLQALGARGQAAHAARQEMYDGMHRSWQAQQDSIARQHGQRIDRIYEGTTMHGGGVQNRIDDGFVGYTDGYGNVTQVPEGRDGPDGWQRMQPTFAAPR